MSAKVIYFFSFVPYFDVIWYQQGPDFDYYTILWIRGPGNSEASNNTTYILICNNLYLINTASTKLKKSLKALKNLISLII